VSIDYTAEKMYVAVNSLVTGDGSLRDRLFYAWLGCHTLNPETKEDFPNNDLRSRFRTLVDEMSSKPALRDEGTVRATLNQASENDLRRWATEFFDIFREITEIYARSDRG
jgi:hypothetical protein